jgi:hypothetical protein
VSDLQRSTVVPSPLRLLQRVPWPRRKHHIQAKRIHIGCDTVRLDGFVNVDCRGTRATDLVYNCRDLSPFASSCAELVYSNAFFEHLRIDERAPFLIDAQRVLRENGCLVFTGLPDFEGVARAYLERRPGNVSPLFDLYEAYRYTHGAPEGRPTWWYAQLHKGLLDVPTMLDLLRRAGFAQGIGFTYCWGPEPTQGTFGCVARREAENPDSLEQRIPQFLRELPTNANLDSLRTSSRF